MIDSRTLERAKACAVEQIATEHRLKLRGRIERVGPCPQCGGTDRFSINTRKQLFHCRRCGAGGDVIAFVQFLDGCDFREAVARLTGARITQKVEHRPRQNEHIDDNHNGDDYERQQRDKALHLWRASQQPEGTPVEAYLHMRLANARRLPVTVRYLPPQKMGQRPAMIVPYGVRKITAVQLTLLKPDGSGKADTTPNKITVASPAGMPMVIAPPNDLLGLAITEGVEDALSVHYATGLGAWASGGASFMPKLAPVVPNYIEAVTIYAHADEAGQRGANELADLLSVRGIEIRIEGRP